MPTLFSESLCWNCLTKYMYTKTYINLLKI